MRSRAGRWRRWARAGRSVPRQAARNVVRAVGLMRHALPDEQMPTLVLVGGETAEPDPVATPEIGVLRRLADELGIANHVRFTGRRQPDELRWYYAAGDVAVTTP